MTKIYLITNLITNQHYVGKTKYSLAHRFYQHCNNMYYHTYIHNAILKYGKENFSICELHQCDDADWQFWETYFIKKYNAHYSAGGYNLTWGGENNPMDDPLIREHHKSVMSNDVEHKSKSRERLIKYNSSDLRKQHDLATSLRQKGVYVSQFQKHNVETAKAVAIIDADGTILHSFDSYGDACKYITETTGRPTNRGDKSAIARYADKFNKNGTRKRYLGYYWHKL